MYNIPESLKTEIGDFAKHVTDFRNGEIEAVKFKAIRVPMGIYEQRANGTFMVRVRCAAGMITPTQLKNVALLAQKEETEPIHITTRQELQLHNVRLEQAPNILEQLYQMDLSSRGGGGNTVRNIMASDDARISTDEIFDVTPYALALTNTLIAEADSWSLPRKYKIALAGNDLDNANATFSDLGLIATIRSGEKGFKVYIGGGLGSKPTTGFKLSDFIPATDLLYVGEALKILFSEHGNRRNKHKARIRYIIYKLGEERVFELFYEILDRLKSEGKYELVLPEVSPEISATNVIDFNPANEILEKWQKRYVRKQKQKGFYAVEVPFDQGMAKAETLIRLADFLAPLGDDVLRFTMRQNILLRNIPGQILNELYQLLKDLGIEVDQPRILNSLVACTGADTCRLGICLARGASSAIKESLSGISESQLDKMSNVNINLSGCPNSCGQHSLSQLGFYGKASRNDRLYPAYNVVAGGRTGDKKAQLASKYGEISARDLPTFTAQLLERWSLKHDQFADFNAYLDQEGQADITELLSSYESIPPFEKDKNYYFDWGAEEIFSLKGKGTAECSAGMFDMIDFDRDAILDLQKGIEHSHDQELNNKSLFGIVFHASRMLLVTRGIEPNNRDEVFSSFIQSFIEEGHIDRAFEPIVRRAMETPQSTFIQFKTSVEALATAVINLYNNMDDSLQFKIGKEIPLENSVISIHSDEKRFKDFRGVACPMNFVKTKIELASMKSGELLEILLDDGAPIQNVPGSVRNEGHHVLEEKKEENFWSVLIRKQ
ncbi:MAG TPA: sulfurtransferase TusA family protein [Prolixibacteraceae bacterium]|nr:sulfurtransferase TusA family protein [Prolixibacteraceae bacterium]